MVSASHTVFEHNNRLAAADSLDGTLQHAAIPLPLRLSL